MVQALIDVIVKWVVNILVLLLLLMYLFGVMGVYFFGYKTNTIRDEENWGTLPQAMLTLFGFVTVCEMGGQNISDTFTSHVSIVLVIISVTFYCVLTQFLNSFYSHILTGT